MSVQNKLLKDVVISEIFNLYSGHKFHLVCLERT
jgi:hypothetical protein